MFRFKIRFLIALAVLVFTPAQLLAQEKGIPAEAAKDAEALVKGLEKLATIAEDNQANCDAMGDAMIAFLKKDAGVLKELTARMDSLDADTQEALRVKFEAQINAAGEKFMTGAMACFENAKVQQAMAMLDSGASAEDLPVEAQVSAEALTADNKKKLETLLNHLSAVGEIGAKNSQDCAAMGAALDAYATKNKDDIAKIVAAIEKLEGDQKAASEAFFMGKVETVMMALEPVMNCSSDPGVTKAMDAIFAVPK